MTDVTLTDMCTREYLWSLEPRFNCIWGDNPIYETSIWSADPGSRYIPSWPARDERKNYGEYFAARGMARAYPPPRMNKIDAEMVYIAEECGDLDITADRYLAMDPSLASWAFKVVDHGYEAVARKLGEEYHDRGLDMDNAEREAAQADAGKGGVRTAKSRLAYEVTAEDLEIEERKTQRKEAIKRIERARNHTFDENKLRGIGAWAEILDAVDDFPDPVPATRGTIRGTARGATRAAFLPITRPGMCQVTLTDTFKATRPGIRPGNRPAPPRAAVLAETLAATHPGIQPASDLDATSSEFRPAGLAATLAATQSEARPADLAATSSESRPADLASTSSEARLADLVAAHPEARPAARVTPRLSIQPEPPGQVTARLPAKLAGVPTRIAG